MMSRGLRVTRTLTPDLWRSLTLTCERLGLPEEPYLFLVNEPVANASAGESKGKLVVTVTSGLVRLATANELVFVLGHELGHYGLGHTRAVASEDHIVGDMAEMQRQADQRAAEISADRVGIVAAQSLVTAAMVKVKMACGLGSEHVRLDASAFVDQLRASRESPDRGWELYQSHPSLPLRLLALILFADSDSYLTAVSQPGRGRPIASVDDEIRALLEDSGGRHGLAAVREERVQRAVVWFAEVLAVEVAAPDPVHAASEEVSKESALKARHYVRSFGLSDGIEKLESAMQQLAGHGAAERDAVEGVRLVIASAGQSVEHTSAFTHLPPSVRLLLTAKPS